MKVNYEYKAKIGKVIDGDTIDVVIDLGFKITTFKWFTLQRYAIIHYGWCV